MGYKEIYNYLDGEITLETAIELIKRNTRHYAKRQLTWLRRVENAYWLTDKSNAIMERVILDTLR